MQVMAAPVLASQHAGNTTCFTPRMHTSSSTIFPQVSCDMNRSTHDATELSHSHQEPQHTHPRLAAQQMPHAMALQVMRPWVW